MKAATKSTTGRPSDIGFQSTPPVKAATLGVVGGKAFNTISIHAAREGGDRQICVIACDLGISIHAAREGGDTIAV